MTPQRRVVVIGAARVLTCGPFQEPRTPWSLSAFIDASDVVIRMNNLKNMGSPGLGRKTDILAITNTGHPGRRYAQRARLDHPAIADVREIWFGSAPELVESKEAQQMADVAARENWAPAIVERQGWSDRKWTYIPAERTRAVIETLRVLGARSRDPSLGMRVVAQVLTDDRFRDHAVHVIGFGFQGATAHDFDAERRLFQQYDAAGRLVRMAASPGGWLFPHRSAAWIVCQFRNLAHRPLRRRMLGRGPTRSPAP